MSHDDELVIRRVANGKIHAAFKPKANGSSELLLVKGDVVLAESVVSDPEGDDGFIDINFQIPAELISDGVIFLEIKRTVASEALGATTIIAGQPLDYDLHAEVASLRAELDMLKAAFRERARKSSR